MSITHELHTPPATHLRLFSADTHEPGPSRHKPSDRWTLSQFWHDFYRVIVCRENKPGTIEVYGHAIAHWAAITGDPPLSQIDEYTIAQFCDGLKVATYQRGLAGNRRLLSQKTQDKHCRAIRVILGGAGPATSHRRLPTKALIAEVPHVPVKGGAQTPKGRFTIEQAAQLVAKIDATHNPRLGPIAKHAPDTIWWRAFLGLMYGLGARLNTVWQLEWSMLRRGPDGGFRLDVPAALVSKTDKGGVKAIPDWLGVLLGELPRHHATILAPRLTVSGVRGRHEAYQRGIILDPLPFQAWRRTHAEQMGMLGLSQVTSLMQSTLDHHSAATTTRHYADMEDHFRRRLPCPWGEARERRQLLLF